MNYKAIIFDLGGVLLNLSFKNTSDAFRALGLTDFDAIYSKAVQSGLFDDFETGKSSPAVFRENLRSWIKQPVSDAAIDAAWNAMLLDFPEERLALLRSLKTKHRLFLLSNTNEIHLEAVFRIFEKAGFGNLDEVMEKQYFSCRMGLRKPDPEIFVRVLSENKLDPSDTLFIDDSIQHVLGARSTGIAALHLEEGKTILDLFPSF
jgi:FMN phosphatase YigB (HAD superfamily)